MKCLAPHYMGDFALKGAELRAKGINRIGNLLVPNRSYCLFEDWLTPMLDEMLDEQNAAAARVAKGEPGAEPFFFSPSSMIKRMGERIDNKDSILYWAAKNDIPIFCPAITDGSIGDMLYFHSFKRPGLVMDIAQDIRKLNNMALKVRSPFPVPRSMQRHESAHSCHDDPPPRFTRFAPVPRLRRLGGRC